MCSLTGGGSFSCKTDLNLEWEEIGPFLVEDATEYHHGLLMFKKTRCCHAP